MIQLGIWEAWLKKPNKLRKESIWPEEEGDHIFQSPAHVRPCDVNSSHPGTERSGRHVDHVWVKT